MKQWGEDLAGQVSKPEDKAVIRQRAGMLADSLQPFEQKFDGVKLGETKNESGIEYNLDTGELHLDPSKVFGVLKSKTPEEGKVWLDQAMRHELDLKEGITGARSIGEHPEAQEPPRDDSKPKYIDSEFANFFQPRTPSPEAEGPPRNDTKPSPQEENSLRPVEEPTTGGGPVEGVSSIHGPFSEGGDISPKRKPYEYPHRENVGPYYVATDSPEVLARIKNAIAHFQEASGIDLKEVFERAGQKGPVYLMEQTAEEMPDQAGAYGMDKRNQEAAHILVRGDRPGLETTLFQEIGHHMDHLLLGNSQREFASALLDEPAVKDLLKALQNSGMADRLRAAQREAFGPTGDKDALPRLGYYAETHEMVARAIEQAVPRILELKYRPTDPKLAAQYWQMGQRINFPSHNKDVKLTPLELDSILPSIKKVFDAVKAKYQSPSP